ncbi:unnamed protein product [Lupinus luteus]|uniref:PABS domain-containing protein n=1 Tax=Lupinus luteus TaxID=3873 RepID=A0AAV1WZL7_LUPLU
MSTSWLLEQEVVGFCKSYLVVNWEAFLDPRLEVIINDARGELEGREESYDVIIGDLADPIEGGPCYKLYTKSFYEFTVKRRLKQGGIFVTQAGPAGIFSHTEVFSYVVPYSAHIPSYADIWGWVMSGGKVNISAGGATPLHIAADNGSLELINCLFKAGTDPNISDECLESTDSRNPIVLRVSKHY